MNLKKSYQKPVVNKIKLMPEDAVLATCKGPIGTNSSSSRCRNVAACSNKAQGS